MRINRWYLFDFTPGLHREKGPFKPLGQDSVWNDPKQGIFLGNPRFGIRGVPGRNSQYVAAGTHGVLIPMDSCRDLLIASCAQELVFLDGPEPERGVDVSSGSFHALTHQDRS